MAGKFWLQEWEVADHSVSMVRKQRAKNASIQLAVQSVNPANEFAPPN